MDKKTTLVSTAESLFDHHGFNATGMDRLTQAAGMSSRTLYKHAGSKTALIVAVLSARDQRFEAQMQEVKSITGLFEGLEEWVRVEGARGCLFLRARGETGGEVAEINEATLAHKTRVRERIEALISAETDEQGDPMLAEQILVLFEGATAAAVYRGVEAVTAARHAAAALMMRNPS